MTQQIKRIVTSSLDTGRAYLAAAGFKGAGNVWIGDVGTSDCRQAVIHATEDLSGRPEFIIEIRQRAKPALEPKSEPLPLSSRAAHYS